ncbi:unnamed protein product [Triticum turgidum subsp. durum]|uniref:Uncharacterized protein n=1 Tax=Triticum turgidum subsp. durum TaxID=4567 RepID=A0A9R0SHN5_TRITD|nr:unnamed protein product [Triticum turgidum subsp. durum]
MILGGLIDSLTGANKSARLKGTVVLMRKNVLDLTDLGATIMDGIGDFLGKGVTCQLISSTLVDHGKHSALLILLLLLLLLLLSLMDGWMYLDRLKKDSLAWSVVFSFS